ncbi:MAG: glycosyltransferase family 2 protein [Sedimentisphaerales bacterium]|nr:glycosyltransferase family 2 protein [Sedimentisphaerales bacterium]
MTSIVNENPLVSIGIPTYNRPLGLKHTLECITSQTYRQLEIIVSDNCSPDKQVEKIAREFASNDPRIKYHVQDKNMGASQNFKFVLEQATGKYFMWAADDDYWDQKFIQTGIEALLADNFYQAWFCSVEQIDEQGNSILRPPSISGYSSTKNKKADIIKYLHTPKIMMIDCITYSIFEREALINVAHYLYNDPKGFCDQFRMAFLARYNILISDKILFHKRISSKSLKKMIDEGKALTKYSHRSRNLYEGVYSLKRAPTYIKRQYQASKGTGYEGTVLLTLILMLPASIVSYIISRVIRKTKSVAKRVKKLRAINLKS